MRKLLIALLVLVGLLLLAVPAVVGMHAEVRYKEMVGQLEMSGFRVIRHDYQRGWFDATAETDLELPVPQMPDPTQQQQPKPVGFTLRSDIAHGPFSQGVTGEQLLIDSQILSQGKPLFPADYPALIQTKVSLDGEGRTLIDLPAIDLPAREGHPAISFQGAKGEMEFRTDNGRMAMNLELPSLQLSSGQQAGFVLEGMSLTGDYTRSSEGLMLGTGDMKARRIGMASATGITGVEIRNLDIEVESAIEAKLVNGRMRYRLDSIKVAEDNFGPIDVELQMDNLSALALAQIQQGMDELGQQQLPPQQRGMAAMGVMLNNGPVLLKDDPRFAIKRLHVQTPDGVIDGSLKVQPVGLEWAEIANMPAILNKLEAEAELQMPERLFLAMFKQQARQVVMMQIEQQRMLGEEVAEPDPEQMEVHIENMARQQLDGLLQQEILVRKGEDIATVASLRNGLLTVNGKSLPLPIMQPPPGQ